MRPCMSRYVRKEAAWCSGGWLLVWHMQAEREKERALSRAHARESRPPKKEEDTETGKALGLSDKSNENKTPESPF